MSLNDHNASPYGRRAARWFIFLSVYHLLPMPWFMGVVAGLAPPSFLLLGGLASLFNTDSDSLAFAGLLLAPALLAGLACWLLALLLAALIGLVRPPLLRSLLLLLVLGGFAGVAMTPVYVTGGHSGEEAFNLLEFIQILEGFRVPKPASAGYFTALAWLLGFLLFAQHRPQVFPALPRRFGRRFVAILVVLALCAMAWTHRVRLVIVPLAELGFASQQYRLAMIMKEHSGHRINKSAREWLTRAAEQDHLQAAMELAEQPQSAEDKLRWLTVAAEGGLAEAEFELYRLLLRSKEAEPVTVMKWLQRSAQGGDPFALYELGKLHAEGSERFGLGKDPARSRELWEQAASQGHGQATNELAWRYNMGVAGYRRDPQRAVTLYKELADGFAQGTLDLPRNASMAAGARRQAAEITVLQEQISKGDAEALFTLGAQLVDIGRENPATVAEGFELLERAADAGRADVQYFLGSLFMYGKFDQPKDYARGRHWWEMAAAQQHVRAMEAMAKAYQSGQYETPVDLLKSKAMVERLLEAYRDGRHGVVASPQKADYWGRELKHFERLFANAGGSYQPLEGLRSRAASGDLAARYQLGRQLLVSGSRTDRQEGYRLIAEAAEAGYAEAQYRLVTYYENHLHIMRDEPQRGLALLTAAADQGHLPAMGELALAYYKGRYGLQRDYRKAKTWYDALFAAYDRGDYLGEIDDRFVKFQERQLGYTEKALATQVAREERIANASPLERQIIAIEDRYRKEYEDAVNALDRRDGSREGLARFRDEVDRLRFHYHALRDQEIEELKHGQE